MRSGTELSRFLRIVLPIFFYKIRMHQSNIPQVKIDVFFHLTELFRNQVLCLRTSSSYS